jgi:hypothetical protein
MSTLFLALLLALALILLAARYVLGIVRDALQEMARDEIKAAIPHLSFGLVRRAAADLPEDEHSIIEEWEQRLERQETRPLAMLVTALNIYKERRALATELAEPELASDGATAGSPRLRPNLSRFVAGVSASVDHMKRAQQPILSIVLSALGLTTGYLGLNMASQRFMPWIPVAVAAAIACFLLAVGQVMAWRWLRGARERRAPR